MRSDHLYTFVDMMYGSVQKDRWKEKLNPKRLLLRAENKICFVASLTNAAVVIMYNSRKRVLHVNDERQGTRNKLEQLGKCKPLINTTKSNKIDGIWYSDGNGSNGNCCMRN